MSQLSVFTGYVETMPRRTRMIAGGSIVFVVALAIGIAYFFRGNDAALFARPLDAQQLSEVENRLTAWDIPFHATPDNVVVDAGHKRDVLLQLITAGVPHPHLPTSVETLKDVNALTPDSVLDAQVKEGLQGDLAEGMRGMAGVLDAQVMIAPAQRGFFVDEASHDSSASVRLTLDRGVSLPPESVSGMRSYVAGAVPGLAPDHVSIVDQTGRDLSARSVAVDGTEDTGLEKSLQTALDTTVGTGETFVLAHLEATDSATTSHEVKHVPMQDKIVATDAEREHYVGKNKSYDKVRQSTDRGSDTIESNTQTAAGGIKHLSVAVFVDERRASMIPKITQVVGAAAGIVQSRGDSLVVQAIHFDKAPAALPAAPAASAPQPMLASFGGVPLPILILGLASLAAFGIAGRSMWSQLMEERHTGEVAARKLAADEFEPVRVHAALRNEPPHTAAAILASLPSPITTAVLELYSPEQRREIVKRLAKQVAPVVRDVSVQAGRA